MKHRLVATAGHVDHGKTSLLKSLTGTDADRLEEEQKRGLTIDLGFADLLTDDLQVGFIDVPGHQNFIKNMVSGVGSVQAVLFVVSAVDGWQEQSREHFEIIRMLEPDVLVFALTKIDLADEDFRLLVEAEIEEATQATPYQNAPIIPASSKSGRGIDSVRTELLKRLKQTPDPVNHEKPYCPIDRVFSVKGQGTVVTGSLSGGTINVEQPVVRMPAQESGRIRGLQQYHEDQDKAHFPARTAVNVPDWDQQEVNRGDILTVPEAGRIASIIDGLFSANRHLRQELSHDQQVLGYSGTDRFTARVLMPDQQSFEASDQGLLRLEREENHGFYRAGDRIILRDFADRRLLGCLHVGEVDPEGSFSDSSYREWLRSRFPVNPKNYVNSELTRTDSLTPRQLSQGSRFSPAVLTEYVDEATDIRWLGERERIIHEKTWEHRLKQARKIVNQFHESEPHRRGIPLNQWIASDDPLRPFLREFLESGPYQTDEEILYREDFEPHLPEKQQEPYEKLIDELVQAGLEPPGRAELEKRYGIRPLEYGIESGVLVIVSEEFVYPNETIQKLKTRLCDWMADGDPRRLSEIRDFLDSSRKYVIPLMEYLDQQDITIREGDVRYLRQDR